MSDLDSSIVSPAATVSYVDFSLDSPDFGVESPKFGVVNPDDLFPPLPNPPLYVSSDATTEAAQRDAGSPREGKRFFLAC